MGKLKALLLSGAVAFGAVGSVHAADLPPPPALEPVVPEPVDFGGWYLRGDVGVGIVGTPDIRSSFDAAVPDARFNQRRLNDTFFLGGGVGYQLNNWFRFDVTGEYRGAQSLNEVESYNIGAFAQVPNGNRAYDLYTGSVQSSVFLANAYFDLATFYRLTPFVTAGIGGSYNRVLGLNDVGAGGPNGNGNGGFGYASDTGKFDLAWDVGAGVAYTVNPNLRLELAYRYLDMGDVKSGSINCVNASSCTHEIQKIHLDSQDVKLGMRWMFSDVGFGGGVVPAAYPAYAPTYTPPAPAYTPAAPLVRKY